MHNANGHSIYEFGKFRLDVGKLMLYKDQVELTLPPKVVKTLLALVESGGEILSKDELMERVWEDSIVEDSNLSQYLYILRKTLGSTPEGNPYIETLRRRGYRFNGNARVVRNGKYNGASVQPTGSHLQTQSEGNVLRVAEWAPTQSSVSPAESEPPAPAKHRRSIFWSVIAPILLVGAVGTGFVYYWLKPVPDAKTNSNRSETTITRLTNGSFVYGATISPDGGYFAYSEIDGKTSRLFVQQTGQNARVEIAATSDLAIGGITFSPDGRWIYYITSGKTHPPSALYRVPAIGGPAVKLLENAGNSVSFSPDGGEIVFDRTNGQDGSVIAVSDKDGRGEKVLVQRLGSKSVGNVAWEPNGKAIAFVELDKESGWKCRLRKFDLETGSEEVITEEESWDSIHRIEWVPDGSGLVMIATRHGESLSVNRDQLYFVTYPGGKSRRITNDGNRHFPSSLGITKNGEVISVPADRSSQIWSMDSKGEAASAYQLTRGAADGRGGLVAMGDGRIAYTSRLDEDVTISIANADGSNSGQILTGFKYLEELRGDPYGKFFIFSAPYNPGGPSKQQLFRVDVDGSNVRPLTSGNFQAIDSSVSQDGTIVTDLEDMTNTDTQSITLNKISPAGDTEKFADAGCRTPVFSPDGSMISCVRKESEALVISASTGQLIETFQLPRLNGSNVGALWTPDGKGLVIITHENGVSNLTVLPRDGAKPYKLTNFTSGVIYRFAFSPDGSRIFLARGYPSQEAVLIRNAI